MPRALVSQKGTFARARGQPPIVQSINARDKRFAISLALAQAKVSAAAAADPAQSFPIQLPSTSPKLQGSPQLAGVATETDAYTTPEPELRCDEM